MPIFSEQTLLCDNESFDPVMDNCHFRIEFVVDSCNDDNFELQMVDPGVFIKHRTLYICYGQ